MHKPKYTIAVSGLNNVDSPGSGVPVIRALREADSFDVRIIGLSYDAFEPGLYMKDLLDYSYQIPFPSSGQDALLKRLQYINEREKIDVLIPNFDSELFCYIRIADYLKEKMGISTFLPTEAQFEERHKAQLSAWGKKYDIPVPEGIMIQSIYEIEGAIKQLEYPVVVKGKYYDAGIAYSLDQAKSLFHKISAKWGLPIILQKFVSGAEVNMTVLGDGQGGMTGAVPMRKQVITDKGKAWAGVTLEDERMMEFAAHVMRQTRWRGPCELEMIRNEKGNLYLIEMNPRFPAWIYLACGAGQNHPEALVHMALGRDIQPLPNYQPGKLFIRYSWDMIVDMKSFEQVSVHGEINNQLLHDNSSIPTNPLKSEI
jgi:carbamoyl-phosphate synthase large subunit